MLENILCDVTPSVERVRRSSSGTFEPVYAGETSPARLKLVGAIQRGALAFVDDVCRTLGPAISDVTFSPDITTSLLSDFLASPSTDDARLFVGAKIEDTFSGAATRYFISPVKTGASSYWKAGEAALQPPTKQERPAAPTLVKKKVSAFRRPLIPIVRPVVAKIGNKKDVRDFNEDPAGFFAQLRNPWYRGVGAILFPPH
jgi:hypothetical protein